MFLIGYKFSNFSICPGGAYRDQTLYSGEEFYDVLQLLLQKNPEASYAICFEGTYPCIHGFVRESFGKLSEEDSKRILLFDGKRSTQTITEMYPRFQTIEADREILQWYFLKSA